MKKRILAALLAAVILLTLAGCANNKADAPAPDTTRPTVTATVETTGTAESDTDTEHTEEIPTLPTSQANYDNRFHFNNISFCLPDNVYLNTDCEEYENCIELQPVDADFRIIIFGDYSEGGTKQFFAKGEDEACYRWISEMTTVTVGNLTGYSLSYKSAHSAYTEYRFDIRGEEANVLGFLVHGKTTLDMDETCRHPAVVALLQSLKTE